jgi:hypothetical protein
MGGDGIGAFGFWLAIGAGQVAFWWAMTPLIPAFADRIRAKGALPAAVEARLQALESRSPVTGETDAVYHRLEELEERLEFSERLLAQSREGAALPRGEVR